MEVSEIQKRMRTLVKEKGEPGARKALGVNATLFARALAGLKLHDGSWALLEARLKALEAEAAT